MVEDHVACIHHFDKIQDLDDVSVYGGDDDETEEEDLYDGDGDEVHQKQQNRHEEVLVVSCCADRRSHHHYLRYLHYSFAPKSLSKVVCDINLQKRKEGLKRRALIVVTAMDDTVE